ncbi:hypothetical protein ACFX2I_001722 [Malus domestica]
MHSEFSLGRGGAYAEQKHAAENSPPCYGVSILSPACSTKYSSAAAETGVGDVLYGKNDVRDFMYREDDLEKHRRSKYMQIEDHLETHMRSAVIYRAKRKRRASLAGCLEFLKTIFCLKF